MSKRIVWIEEDTYIIRSVVRPLEDRGYQIDVVENMHDALERIDDLKKCDLILLDIILPTGTVDWEEENHVGLAILRRLRAQGVTTPVIALTVVRKTETTEALHALGVKHILHKPVLPSELEKKVLQVLGEVQQSLPASESP
jgi:CheY-like chemotaxis protein